MSPRRVILADMSWLCYRYYFSPLHKRMSVEIPGQGMVFTGKYYGFGQLVRSASAWGGKIVFCEDVGLEIGVTPERTAEFELYKAGRLEHPEVWEGYDEIKSITCCHPAVWYSNSPGLEADDVLAMHFFAEKEKNPETEVIIYSGDNDMVQLMSYGAKVARNFKDGDFEFVDDAYLEGKFPGVPKNQILRYRILVGDPSDNIPPVVPRLNRDFIRKFIEVWTQKGLSEALTKFKHEKHCQRLIANREALRRNMALMDLTKYRKPEERQKANVTTYKVPKRPDLLDLYRLEKFKSHLTELEAIAEMKERLQQ